MKTNFNNGRLELFPENSVEERFAQNMHRLVDSVSKNFTSWYGDIRVEGKETSGYVIHGDFESKTIEDSVE